MILFFCFVFFFFFLEKIDLRSIFDLGKLMIYYKKNGISWESILLSFLGNERRLTKRNKKRAITEDGSWKRTVY